MSGIGEAAWKNLDSKDYLWDPHPEPIRQVHRKYVISFPDTALELLKKEVSYYNIIKLKLEYARHQNEGNYINEYLASIKQMTFKDFVQKRHHDLMEELASSLSSVEDVLKLVPEERLILDLGVDKETLTCTMAVFYVRYPEVICGID